MVKYYRLSQTRLGGDCMLKVVCILAILAIAAFVVYWAVILSQNVWYITYNGIISKEKKSQEKDHIKVIRDLPGNDRMDGQIFNLSLDEYCTGWRIVVIPAKSQIIIETPRKQVITPIQAESLLKKLNELVPTASSGGSNLRISVSTRSHDRKWIIINHSPGARKFSKDSVKELKTTLSKTLNFWYAKEWPTKSRQVNKWLLRKGSMPNPTTKK